VAISELIALIPPPSQPVDADGDWSVPAAEFGMEFPSDFRELIHHYGTGEFGLYCLMIYNPLTSAGRKEIQESLQNLRDLCDACEFPLILHPKRPGLLPWGSDAGGNWFCWSSEGYPDQWPIVQVAHNEEENPHRANVNISTFLANYAQNKYPEMLGGRTFEPANHRYLRGRPWDHLDPAWSG
jgi:hypothetical protein